MKTASIAMLVVGLALGGVAWPQNKIVEGDKLHIRDEDGLIYEIDSEEPFTGTAVDYWSSGQKQCEGEIRNGKLTGKYTFWLPDGEKVQEIEYCDGEKQLETVFWPNGLKRWDNKFCDGVVIIRTWDEEGNLFGHTEWGEDGLISLEVWNPDGNLIHDYGGQKVVGADKLVDRDGLRYEINSAEPFTGIAVDYYPMDELQVETQYRDGVKNGKEIEWNKDGTKSEEGEWRDGKENGKRIIWTSNGEKIRELEYCDGEKIQDTKWKDDGKEVETKLPNGKWVSKKWDKDGNLVAHSEYDEDGNSVSHREYEYCDGKMISCKSRDGNLRIEEKWDEDGNLLSRKEWDEEGNLIWEEAYSLIGNYVAPTPAEQK